MIQFETTNQLNFELFGITYLVGKIKFQGPKWLSESCLDPGKQGL